MIQCNLTYRLCQIGPSETVREPVCPSGVLSQCLRHSESLWAAPWAPRGGGVVPVRILRLSGSDAILEPPIAYPTGVVVSQSKGLGRGSWQKTLSIPHPITDLGVGERE
jgi:hypothetical protein